MPTKEPHYVEKPGMHRHRCPRCYLVWEHADAIAEASAADCRAAHLCPGCGTDETWRYSGPLGPDCAHPKQTPPRCKADRPNAGFLADSWAAFQKAIPSAAPGEGRDTERYAFYAAAKTFYGGLVAITKTMDPLLMVAFLDGVRKELDEYGREIAEELAELIAQEPEAKKS